MKKNDDCIFCKIISGEIPSVRIAESQYCISILDAFPAARGHSLVIPKSHSDDIFSMSDEELTDAIRLLRDVAASIKKTVKCPGINLLKNIGRPAGQLVFHAHFHAIPRFEDDGIRFSLSGKVDVPDDERDELVKALKINLP